VYKVYERTVDGRPHLRLLQAVEGRAPHPMGFTGAPSVPGKCPSCPRFGASAQPLFVEGFIRDAQGDRVVTVTTASYRLDVIEDGRIAHSIRRDIPPTRLTDQLESQRVYRRPGYLSGASSGLSALSRQYASSYSTGGI